MDKAILIHTSEFRGDHSADVIRPLIVDDSMTIKELLELISGGDSVTICHDFKKPVW